MNCVYDRLLYFLHSDDNNYKDLKDLDEVYERVVSITLQDLSSSSGILREEFQKDFEDASIEIRRHLFSTWRNYNHFWKDLYD